MRERETSGFLQRFRPELPINKSYHLPDWGQSAGRGRRGEDGQSSLLVRITPIRYLSGTIYRHNPHKQELFEFFSV